MSNYTQKKFRLGAVWGQTGGRPPGPPLELPVVRGLRLFCYGIDATVYICGGQFGRTV